MFPIYRVVRFDKLIYPIDYKPTLKELDRTLRSIERAIKSLQRQRASLLPRWRHAFDNITEEERIAGVTRARVTDAGYWPVDAEWP